MIPYQVQKIKSIVSQSAPEAERAALFGFRANGTCKNHSDIDLVIYGDMDRATINRLSTLFLESNLPYKVDVRHVVVNGDLVVENGRSTKADQEQIIADAVQASAALMERAGLRDLIADWVEPVLH